MMKRGMRCQVKILILAVAVLSSGAVTACASSKIGYVDLRRTFNEYEEAVIMRGEITDKTEAFQRESNKRVQEITELRGRAEMLSGEAREEMMMSAERKISEFQEYERQKRQELMTRENQMLEEILGSIEQVVTRIALEQGYDYVLDSRYVMYAGAEKDLTDEVLRRLNE